MIFKVKKEIYTFLDKDLELNTLNYSKKEFFQKVFELIEKETEKIKDN